MRVEIVKHTPDPERVVAMAARQCYSAGFVMDFTSTPEQDATLIRKVLGSEHTSILEHVAITVAIRGVSRALSHQLVRFRMASFCLSGDTEVVAHTAKTGRSPRRWTLKRLYEMCTHSDARVRRGFSLIKLRSVDDDGIIVPNTIRAVVRSGDQEVFQVTTESGRVIKATKKHRFLTNTGYVELGNLSVDDFVICNGLPAHKNKEWIHHHYIVNNMQRKDVAAMANVSDACLGKWIRKLGLQKPKTAYPGRKPGYGKKGMFTSEILKRLSEQKVGQNNHRWLGDDALPNAGRLRCIKMYPAQTCSACGATSEHTKVERHHLDSNPLNNVADNIRVLCAKCHKAFHFGQAVTTVFSDKIVSIESVGVEPTYDVEMAAPLHNFVAEGFVVHNSQQSQRYTSVGDEYVVPETIIDSQFGATYHYAIKLAYETYEGMVKAGVPKEDARYVLPNACPTNLIMTMNARELLHAFNLRCCNRASWEIRELFNEILRLVKPIAPTIFENAGASCVAGPCPEGAMGCGKKQGSSPTGKE